MSVTSMVKGLVMYVDHETGYGYVKDIDSKQDWEYEFDSETTQKDVFDLVSEKDIVRMEYREFKGHKYAVLICIPGFPRSLFK